MSNKTAVIVLGHGSRHPGAGDLLERLAADVRSRGGFAAVEHAFLQYAPPGPDEALDRCRAARPERIVLIPFFLQSGTHVQNDIPAFAARARERYPDMDIVITDYVGVHPAMAEILLDLAGGGTALLARVRG